MKPTFSVVVSCYRSAHWLREALESVAAQTFRGFEAICYVEDSPDDSLRICEEMARRDPRFKVVSAPKSGSCSETRNYGAARAAGEYVVSADGDDRLDPRLLEKLAAKLEKTGPVDVLAYAGASFEDGAEGKAEPKRISNFAARDDADGVFSGVSAIRRAGRNGGAFHAFTWLFACRAEFLRANGIRWKTGALIQDEECTPRIWFRAGKFAYLDEVLYFYRRRQSSATTESSSRFLFDLVEHVRSLQAFADANDVPRDVLRTWADRWVSVFYWFAFHPVSSRKVPDSDRLRAIRRLFRDGGLARFARTVRLSSLPKRAAFPLVVLAASGWIFPARFFFRRVFYPAVERRSGKS